MHTTVFFKLRLIRGLTKLGKTIYFLTDYLDFHLITSYFVYTCDDDTILCGLELDPFQHSVLISSLTSELFTIKQTVFISCLLDSMNDDPL